MVRDILRDVYSQEKKWETTENEVRSGLPVGGEEGGGWILRGLLYLRIMNPAQLVENRSVRLIFRDCLKLAGRMVDNQTKTQAVRALIKQQFVRNRDVIDQDEIRTLKMTAVRAISNYIIHTVQEEYKIPRKPVNIYEEHEEEEQHHPRA